MEKNQYEIYHENKKHTPNDFPYNRYKIYTICPVYISNRAWYLYY